MRLTVVDLEEMVTDIEMPPKDPKIDPLRQFIELLSPRLITLRWLAQKKPEAFAPALFSFGLRRRSLIGQTAAMLPPEGWGIALLIPAADRLRRRFGAGWDPLAPTNTWPKALYEAIDDVVTGLWHLRGGMTVSAALIARSSLERWTLNVAHEFDLEQEPDEEDSAYISRVWGRYSHPSIPANVGEWWSWLSEILHGRAGNECFGPELAEPLKLNVSDQVPMHTAICRVLELGLRQIRGGLWVLARDEDLSETLAVFQCEAPNAEPPGEPFPLTDAFLPLEYYEVHRQRSEQWVQLASTYRTNVEEESWRLTTTFSPLMACEAMLERRGRAVERARHAFAEEEAQLGGSFDPGLLASKIFRFVSIAQMGRILASESSGHEQNALVTASQAVDGAAQLWLEDSDHALGCVRILLEQTARLRAHRLKPERAAKLEANCRTPASRWVSTAGWGRLAVLVRAVNEFAHLGSRTRRRAARTILKQIQFVDDGLETSRGDAVTSVAYMFAFELHARLSAEPEAASAFTKTVTLMDEASHIVRLESYLNKAHAQRDWDFGLPDYISSRVRVSDARGSEGSGVD